MRHLTVTATSLILSLGLFAQEQDEKDFAGWMKTTQSTMGSLRKNLEAKSGDAAAADAKKLEEIFTQVHDFWMKKKIEKATKFSTDAQNGFKEVAAQATAGKFEEAQATLKSTMANCAGCHGAYREKNPDGSWKIKYN